MPLPSREKGEADSDFIDRCMGDAAAKEEFPSAEQRLAVCRSQLDKHEQAITAVNFRQTATLRKETFDGKPHIVAPVVAAVEGVLNGSLLTAEEMGKYVQAWNGIPVPVMHPESSGQSVSANSPQVIDERTVGRFFNARMDSGRLKGEIWINLEKAEKVAPGMIEAMQGGEVFEVSTAYWSDMDPARGSFSGNSYNGVYTNLRPDHLALLPGEIGACSIEDGCGCPRINSKGETMKRTESMLQKLARMVVGEGAMIANKSMFDTLEQVAEAAKQKFGGDVMVVDVMPDEGAAIVEANEAGEGEEPAVKTYRVSYTENEGAVDVGDDAVEVARVTEYRPVSEGGGDQPGAVSKDGKEEDSEVNTNAVIKGLIANEKAPFSEADKKYLSGLSEDKLQAFADLAGCGCKDEPKLSSNSAEDFIAQAPEEMRDVLDSGLRLHREKRAGLIEKIVAHSSKAYTAEELEAKPLGEIEKIAALAAVARPDYSGRGGPRANAQDGNDEIPAPPKVSDIFKKA